MNEVIINNPSGSLLAGKVFSVMGSVENLVLLGNSLLYNRVLWPLALQTLHFPPLPYLVAIVIIIVPAAHLLYASIHLGRYKYFSLLRSFFFPIESTTITELE